MTETTATNAAPQPAESNQQAPYPHVQSDIDFPALEREVLAFWKEQEVFEASVERRPAQAGDGNSNAYVFYDGPPFANGLPHHGHLLTGFVKDAVARHQTMQGKRVERRFGWDCHGLPAEMEAEKQLGVSGRQEIMAHGVEAFNDHCRNSVMRYRYEWEAYVNRQARWVDFANDYKTMDRPYMESVLWGFKQLYDNGLIYEGFKVMPYSWAAETVLSNAEIRLDDATREKIDKAVEVAFRIDEVNEDLEALIGRVQEVQPGFEPRAVYLVAWTTTPWTLPANLALAVSPSMQYKAYIEDGALYIASAQWVDTHKGEQARFIVPGEEAREEPSTLSFGLLGLHLMGLRYKPLLPYMADREHAFVVLEGDFIEEGAGTGIVHLAPGFGEDDQRVCAEAGIEVVVPVDDQGRYEESLYPLTALETERCLLMPPSAADEAAFIALHTNKEVMKTVNDGVMSEDEARADFAANLAHFREHGYGQWAVYHKQSGAFMGRAGLTFIAQSREVEPRPTLRCALLPEFWRGGYGGEVCAASLHYGFDVLAASDIAGGALPENTRSHTMMERLGMRYIRDVAFKEKTGPYYLITSDEVSAAEIPASQTHHLELAGLNVIAEQGKRRADEPYSDAQLEKYGLANLRIIQWLKATGHLVSQSDYAHNYPHCWRTDQPIIYKAMSSWFVDVPKIRERMVALNESIHWMPEHIKHGRFGRWLENAREWSISRSRFWGCPIPVWRSTHPDNDRLYVFGSLDEIEQFFGARPEDLHKPGIDALTAPDPDYPGHHLERVPDVFDCWFESGSMPFAQVHYPFENKTWFEANFPADFVVEYEAQTRGWFYNMMVLAVGIFDTIPFKNCICHGVVLDDQGRKLSKRLQNYMDPMALFEQYGADALRWFMLSSPIMRGQELFLDPKGAFIRDAVRLYIKPLWNAYHFFCLYANADQVQARLDVSSPNLMDRYILAKLGDTVEAVRAGFDAYDTPAAAQAITAFLETLNNWYIRRNRARFWRETSDADKLSAYHTLYSVLHILCRTAAPLLPQITEAVYAGLVAGGRYERDHSVHLADYPQELRGYGESPELTQAMDRVQDICTTAHGLRNQVGIRIRQPLASLTVYGAGPEFEPDYFRSLIAEETNVKEVMLSEELEAVATRQLKIYFPIVGKRLGAKMKEVSKAAKAGDWSFNPDGTIAIAGETLNTDEFEFSLQPVADVKDRAAALASQDGLVMLETALSESLRQEGLVRDLVRFIQQSRKEAGFDVSDRIALTLEAGETLKTAIRAFEDYLREQVLASTVAFQAVARDGQAYTTTLADEPVAMHLQRTEAPRVSA